MTIVVIFSTIFRSQWPLLHPLRHPANPPLSLGIFLAEYIHKMSFIWFTHSNVKIYLGYSWKCQRWIHLFWAFSKFELELWRMQWMIYEKHFFLRMFILLALFAMSKKWAVKSNFRRNPQLISAVDSNQPKCNFNQSPIDVGGGGEDEVLGKNNLSEQRPKQHNLHQQRPCLMSEQNKK